MGWTATLVVGGGALLLALFCGWRGARPPDPNRGPRLVPWRLLMVLSGAATVLMIAHIGTLLGVARPAP